MSTASPNTELEEMTLLGPGATVDSFDPGNTPGFAASVETFTRPNRAVAAEDGHAEVDSETRQVTSGHVEDTGESGINVSPVEDTGESDINVSPVEDVGTVAERGRENGAVRDEREADAAGGRAATRAQNAQAQGSTGEENGEAFIHAVRKSKSASERAAAVGGKAGNPGRFHRKMKDFLDASLHIFIDIKKAEKNRNKRLDQFWHDIRTGFWKKFTWVEARELFGVQGANWTASQVMRAVNSAFKNWYGYQWARLSESNPYTLMLRALRKPKGSAPRKPALAQAYLTANREIVNAVYETRVGTPGARGRTGVALRVAIAKELLEAESKEEQDEWEFKVVQEHQEELERYKDAKLGAPSAEPEDQAEARDRLCAVLQPFMSLLAEYTGLQSFTLIGGTPPSEAGGEFLLATVNFGKTAEASPRNFYQFNPDAFKKQIFPPFMDFLQATQEGWTPPADKNSARKEDLPYELHNTEKSLRDAAASGPPQDSQQPAARPVQASSRPKPRATLAIPGWADEHMRRLLGMLKDGDRKKEIERLSKYRDDEEIECQRENNIAGNKLLQLDLGLVTSVGPLQLTSAPLRAPEPGPEDDYVPSDNERQTGRRSPPTTRLRATISSSSNPAGSAILPSLSRPTTDLEPDVSQLGSIPTDRDVDDHRTQTAVEQDDASFMDPPGSCLPSPTPFSPPQEPRDAGFESTTSPSAPLAQTSSPAEPPAIPPSTTAESSGANAPARVSRSSHDAQVLESQSTVGDITDLSAPAFETFSAEGAWIKPLYEKFKQEDVPAGLAGTWRRLLNDWVALEQALNFTYTRESFPRQGRPVEIDDWIKRARKPRFAVTRTDTYAERWVQWWDKCSPEWRPRNASGHPTIGGDGDWSSMAIPGPNGFVLVIGSLVGLSIAADSDVWAQGVRDVQWTLQEVLARVKNGDIIIDLSASSKGSNKKRKAPELLSETSKEKRTRRRRE